MLPSTMKKCVFSFLEASQNIFQPKKKNSTSPAGRELNITMSRKSNGWNQKIPGKERRFPTWKNPIIFRFQPLIFSGPGLPRISRFPGGKWAALDVAQKASLSFSTLPAPMGDPQSWVTWSKKTSGKGGWWWMIRWDWKGIFVGEICYCDFFGGEVSLFKMICWL